MKPPGNLIKRKDLEHSQHLCAAISRAPWETGPRSGRRKKKGHVLFCQVWLKLLCVGQIFNGYMVESKYLTSVYISDSNEQELLTQAAHLVNILGSRTRIEL